MPLSAAKLARIASVAALGGATPDETSHFQRINARAQAGRTAHGWTPNVASLARFNWWGGLHDISSMGMTTVSGAISWSFRSVVVRACLPWVMTDRGQMMHVRISVRPTMVPVDDVPSVSAIIHVTVASLVTFHRKCVRRVDVRQDSGAPSPVHLAHRADTYQRLC